MSLLSAFFPWPPPGSTTRRSTGSRTAAAHTGNQCDDKKCSGCVGRCPLRFLFLVLLLYTACLRAQKPELTGIAHVAFRVTDVNASREFYRKLGFEQAFVFSKQAKPTQAFIKINDTQFIELYAQTNPSQQIGLMHICFESNDLTGLNDVYRKRGLQPTPVKKAAAGNLLFTMQGPEGQNIEFTEYMPGSRHVEDRGKHLGTNRVSTELAGSSLIMNDTEAAEAFYTHRLDFTATGHGNAVRLTLPGNSHGYIELEPANRYIHPQVFFGVNNVQRTTGELKRLGFSVQNKHGAVSVTAPDGTSILFIAR